MKTPNRGYGLRLLKRNLIVRPWARAVKRPTPIHSHSLIKVLLGFLVVGKSLEKVYTKERDGEAIVLV